MCFERKAKVAIHVVEPVKINTLAFSIKDNSKQTPDEFSQYTMRSQSPYRAFSSRRRLDFFIEKK